MIYIQQKLFDSNDYAPKTLAASALDENGCINGVPIVMTYQGINEHETKFGKDKNCFVIDVLIDGKEDQMIFSAKRLATGLMEMHDKIVGKKILIRGYDQGVKRHYAVDLME